MRRAVPSLGVVLLVASLAAPVLAGPPSIADLSGKSSLEAKDLARIVEYAQGWSAELLRANAKPSEVRLVRRSLLAPVLGPGRMAIFRAEYSSALIPELEKVLADGSMHTSINALIILSEIGTETALETLLDHAALSDEPSRHVRLVAARGARRLLSSGRLAGANPNKINGAARDLLAAARVETDYLTLFHQLEAMAAAAEIADASRQHLADALRVTAERAEKMDSAEALDLLRGVYPVINQIRPSFLQLGPVEQKDFGARLGPCLYLLLKVPDTHWDGLQALATPDDQPAAVIYLSAQFLSVVDATVRSTGNAPSAELRKAWIAKDRADYKRMLGRWESVLGQSPYEQ